MYKPKYFSENEFNAVGCNISDMHPDLLRLLDQTREKCGFPLRITSAYRTVEQNKAASGARTSAHLRGTAVDIYCCDSRTRFWVLRSALLVGFHRIGIGQNFVHLDVDTVNPPDVVWLY